MWKTRADGQRVWDGFKSHPEDPIIFKPFSEWPKLPDMTIPVHPIGNYAIIDRESQPEEDVSVPARMARLQEQYEETGIRRSVDAIMLVMYHGMAHVLVLQVANSYYKLPGGYLDPTEDECSGLLTRLDEQLGVPIDTESGPNLYERPIEDWKVNDRLSMWWRPNFDTFLYPYLNAHISEPKEVKSLYLVNLPKNKVFAIPANMKLHAIPIYEFYDNAARYGPQFAGLPYLISRYWMAPHSSAINKSTEHTAYPRPLSLHRIDGQDGV